MRWRVKGDEAESERREVGQDEGQTRSQIEGKVEGERW